MNKKRAVTFTTTISPELNFWLEQRAKIEGQTKRAVLEKSIKTYQEKVTKEDLKLTFQNFNDI